MLEYSVLGSNLVKVQDATPQHPSGVITSDHLVCDAESLLHLLQQLSSVVVPSRVAEDANQCCQQFQQLPRRFVLTRSSVAPTT